MLEDNVREIIWFTGLGIIALGFLWLWVRAFRTSLWWGLTFIIPPVPLVFLLVQRKKVLGPALVLLLGGLVFAFPFGDRLYEEKVIGFGPRERIVDDELHLTLTGWDRSSYFLLNSKPETIVLQMANFDVTDNTLKYLKHMKSLRELDLDNTQITDEGLVILKDLPNLKSLRLGNTKITDEGFSKHVAPLESLQNLNLHGTAVSPETAKAWKAAQKGRRVLYPKATQK